MKIILVGAGGTIGRAVAAELQDRHELVRVGRSSGDLHVDIADPASIEALFAQTGPFDALVCTAGNVHFGPFETFTQAQFELGLRDKLMGRLNLVSPTVLVESLSSYSAFFPGTKAVPASEVALGYAKSVEGAQTGRIYRIGWSRPD